MKRKKTTFKVFFHLIDIQTEYQYYYVTQQGVPGRLSLPILSSLDSLRNKYLYGFVKVTTVHGTLSRQVAVLCFATEQGQKNTPEVQQLFWGRVK